MASLSNVRLRDLYFIEDNRHRRAFLKALKEVEEEGYEIKEVETAVSKIKKVQTSSVQKQKAAANATKAEGNRGATPAELSAVQRLKSQAARKYSQTNAVDLKDYKHWRRDEAEKLMERNNKKTGPKLPGFEFASSKPTTSSVMAGRRPRATLYDELFDEDDAEVASFPKTKTYAAIESILGDDSGTAFEKEESKPEPKKQLVSKSPESRLASRRRAHDSLEKSRKMLEEYIAKQDSSIKPEPKKLGTDDQEKTPKKVVVEVVAPEEPIAEEVPQEVKVQAPKKARKPRGKGKKKKVLDADIKRYHFINYD